MKVIKKFFLKLLLVILVLAMIGTMVIFLVNNQVKNTAEENIAYIVRDNVELDPVGRHSLEKFEADCAIVLGCGIEDAETPSPMLKDRLDVGIELYKEGLVPKILLSGDNGQEGHNEIHVMLKYTRAAGIPAADIFCDHAGFSTYDSMYRAGSIFRAKKVIVVTQLYHEYRALYIGEKLGLTVQGVAADQDRYFGQGFRNAREVLARVKDFGKSIFRLKPTYEGEAIPISGSGISSHAEG